MPLWDSVHITIKADRSYRQHSPIVQRGRKVDNEKQTYEKRLERISTSRQCPKSASKLIVYADINRDRRVDIS